MVPGVLGALIGAFIDHQFNGTITPLAIAFVVGNSIAWLGCRWAIRSASTAHVSGLRARTCPQTLT